MTVEEQSQVMMKDMNAIENMISEGGLGADVYYTNENPEQENNHAVYKDKSYPRIISRTTP
jgi:hypothetical protein